MTEQEINEMALLKVMPLISLGGKDHNFNDRIFYTQGAKDCNLRWEEKLRWIPVEEKRPKNREIVLAKVPLINYPLLFCYNEISGKWFQMDDGDFYESEVTPLSWRYIL